MVNAPPTVKGLALKSNVFCSKSLKNRCEGGFRDCDAGFLRFRMPARLHGLASSISSSSQSPYLLRKSTALWRRLADTVLHLLQVAHPSQVRVVFALYYPGAMRFHGMTSRRHG